MSIEYIILGLSWIIFIVLLIIFVKKDKIRDACLLFLFKQFETWLFGLLVVEFRLIEYPVRFFSYANRASFTFEFMAYPTICVLFNLKYPKNKSFVYQIFYYVLYVSGVTITEVILLKYTDLINYINWRWYLTWITLFITTYISRKFYLWFFKIQ